MKYSFWLLFTVFGLLVTACGPKCDQGWGDSNRSQKASFFDSVDPTAEGDPEVAGATKVLETLWIESPEYEKTDRFTGFDWEKKNIGNDFELCLSTSPSFETNLKEDGFFSTNCFQINQQKGHHAIVIDVDQTIYGYLKFKDGRRSCIQRVRFYNEESDATIPMQCNGMYRKAETTLIAESITSLAALVEGVNMTRYNDRGVCLFENTGGNRVHVAITADGNTNPALEIESLAAGETQEADCALVDGTKYQMNVWIVDIDTNLDNLINSINEEHPDTVVEFVWDSESPSISVTTVSSVEKAPLVIEAAGVNCVIVASNGNDAQGELACENGSASDVEVQLYKLATSDNTNATHERDYIVAKFSLGNAGGATATDSAKFDLEAGNFQIVIVEEFAYYNGDEMGDVSFELSQANNEWSITLLDDAVVVE